MALLLRLHSPHKSLPCKGEPQPINYHILIRQASLASSASTRHFRLHPVLRVFVSRVAVLPRWLPHTGLPRVQPVSCPTLLPGIFATWRPSALQESEGEEQVLPSWTYMPSTEDVLARTSARS